MDEKTVRYLGIIVAIVMLGSMFAVALYGPSTTAPETSTEQLTDAEEFTYNVSFEGKVLRDLGAIRFAAKTSIMDKEVIDKAVMAVDGVSKINSSFKKSTDSNDWYYLSEVYLKKNFDTLKVTEEISSIDYFSNKYGESQYVKYMTISSPGKIELKNEDLNITRDFNFDGTNLYVLASVMTQPNDDVNVSGTIKITGNVLTYVELLEETNLTASQKTVTLQESLPIKELGETVWVEGERDKKTAIDKNTFYAELKAIDETSSLGLYDLDSKKDLQIKSDINFSDDTINALENVPGINSVTQEAGLLKLDINFDEVERISSRVESILSEETFSFQLVYPKETLFGSFNVNKYSQIESVIKSKGFVLKFVQEAEFFKDKFYIPELSSSVDYNSTFQGRLALGHKVGDKILLDIELLITRNTIDQIRAVENGITE